MVLLDRELIILEVEKYRCLYDTKDRDYKNRELKRLSWISVTAGVLGETWRDMDEGCKANIGK